VQERALGGWRPRDVIAAALAVVAGLGIAWLDTGPGWDDTGITAGLLVLTAGLAAGVSGRRPWLWALLVGLPTPLVELAGGGDVASLAAIALAAAGAAGGYLVSHAISGATAA
jgi:hypothetical protein